MVSCFGRYSEMTHLHSSLVFFLVFWLLVSRVTKYVLLIDIT